MVGHLDVNKVPISIGDTVIVSPSEGKGLVRGLAHYDEAPDSCYVDYVCGDGRRIESWWSASLLVRVGGAVMLAFALLFSAPTASAETCRNISVQHGGGHEKELCTKRWIIPATERKPASLCHLSYFTKEKFWKFDIDCDPMPLDAFDFVEVFCDAFYFLCPTTYTVEDGPVE